MYNYIDFAFNFAYNKAMKSIEPWETKVAQKTQVSQILITALYTYYACLQTIASRRVLDLLWMAKIELLDGEIPYLSMVQQFRHLSAVDA